MSMDRRKFLVTSVKAAAAGLIVGEAALEMMERLTHQKRLWTGHDFGPPVRQSARGPALGRIVAIHGGTLTVRWEADLSGVPTNDLLVRAGDSLGFQVGNWINLV